MARRPANAGLLRAWGRADCAVMHSARSWENRKEDWTEPSNALKENTGQLKDEEGMMSEGRKARDIGTAPPPFPVSVDSKKLNTPCKLFKMNTSGDLL